MQSRSRCYAIRVEGHLGDVWLEWFAGLTIRHETALEDGRPITVFYGPIPDQPALHGMLARIRDLNLVLVSVQEVTHSEKGKTDHEGE